jgi:Zn-dependent M28 family amino/carboxypeptidase
MGYLLRQTSFGPRNPESKGHRDCLNYLYSQLLSFADEVRLQEFTAAPYDDKKLRLTNIIASFQPGAKERLLLCAHWDTRPRADYDQNLERRNEPILGANDGASGVAVLLEIASLMSKQPPPVGVDIVLFDGEDYGLEGDTPNYLLGSRHFADTKPPEYVPRFGILLDMVGDRLLEISKEGNSVAFAPDIVELVWTTARSLNCPEFVDVVVEPITDDHVPLNEAGIKTVDLIDFRYPDETHRYWHTHEDTPDKCSAESLEAVGTVLTHVVYTQMP